jgi:scyllo-inositol 2-dehydrogenase (NADP+)
MLHDVDGLKACWLKPYFEVESLANKRKFLTIKLNKGKSAMSNPSSSTTPVRLGIAGMTHGHIDEPLRRPARGDIEIVGIAEADTEVVDRYAKRYGFDKGLIYPDLEALLDETHPEVVAAYGSIYDHLHVVEVCAPRGIHVMVEKPLAVSMEHARRMADLAEKYHIQVLTNYETTWHASNHAVYQMVHEEKRIGQIRKVVVHDGHEGPKEIGCPPEFLAWLTDPVLNGGGAVIDFGCYGCNLMTWLMDGQAPHTVTAVLQQLKPEVYPRVDDEATIIVTYDHAQGIIQGSWNWPIGRKDMEVYGQTGYAHALDRFTIRHQQASEKSAHTETLGARPVPFDDTFSWLAGVVRGTLTVADNDLSGLPNNLIVIQILDAARESARTGKTVQL